MFVSLGLLTCVLFFKIFVECRVLDHCCLSFPFEIVPLSITVFLSGWVWSPGSITEDSVNGANFEYGLEDWNLGCIVGAHFLRYIFGKHFLRYIDHLTV